MKERGKEANYYGMYCILPFLFRGWFSVSPVPRVYKWFSANLACKEWKCASRCDSYPE